MVKKEDILWVHRENIRLVSGGEGLDVEGAFDFPLSDNDGVNDKMEYDPGTNPQDGDTDEDRISDYEEIYVYGTVGYEYNGRYAVLISRYKSSDGEYIAFWNDLRIFHDILVDRGYMDDNTPGFNPSTDHIGLLFGDGNDIKDDFNVKYGTPEGVTITDYSATKSNIKKVFQKLSQVMTDRDMLFVLTFDHGKSGQGHSYLSVQDGEIRDDDFANNYVGLIQHYYRRYFIMQQCFGGGFIDDLKNSRTVILTATKDDQIAHSCDSDEENEYSQKWHQWYHAEFLFYLISALKGETPTGKAVNADRDGNGYISLKEAFEYAYSWDSWNPDGDHYPADPLNPGEGIMSHDTDRNGKIDYSCDMEYPQLSDAGEISDEAYL